MALAALWRGRLSPPVRPDTGWSTSRQWNSEEGGRRRTFEVSCPHRQIQGFLLRPGDGGSRIRSRASASVLTDAKPRL